MANVGFRLGSQKKVDDIIGNGSGAINGSFYLTEDSHRLYIGAPSDTVVGDYTLYPVNEGVETVENMLVLSSKVSQWDATQKKGAAGRFYYIADQNVLAIFNGKEFIQINVDTDTSIKKVEFKATEDDNEERIDIDHTITWGDLNNKSTSNISLVVDNGLTCSTEMVEQTDSKGNKVTYPKITIAGDSYSFTTAVVKNSNEFTLALQSKNGVDTGNPLKVKGMGGIHFEQDEDGNIILSSDDTHLTSDSISITDTTTGIKVTIKDNSGIYQSTALWSPYIRYGQAEDPEERTRAQFKNGTADLNIYTADEIKQLMKSLNGMTYKGTVGPSGSFATKVTQTGSDPQTATYKVLDGTEELQLSIGDTFVLTEGMNIGGTVYGAGTLIIARSSDNTENSDGVIDASKLKLDIIDNNDKYDTTYRLEGLTAADGVMLRDENNSTSKGTLVFEQGVAKKVVTDTNGNTTEEDVEGLNVAVTSRVEGNKTTIVFSHEALILTTETKPVTQNAEVVTFKAIESIETDETGHVSKVVTQDVQLYDTANDVSATTYDTTAYSANGKNIGVVKNTVTSTNKYTSVQTKKADSFVLVSESLAINNDDTNPDAIGGTSNKQGLSIEMVWGTF